MEERFPEQRFFTIRGFPITPCYQPSAGSTFLSEQTSHQQPANSTFISEQISTNHQPPAKRTGWAQFSGMYRQLTFSLPPF
jgi:hypothetical protein